MAEFEQPNDATPIADAVPTSPFMADLGHADYPPYPYEESERSFAAQVADVVGSKTVVAVGSTAAVAGMAVVTEVGIANHAVSAVSDFVDHYTGLSVAFESVAENPMHALAKVGILAVSATALGAGAAIARRFRKK
jgi:hypothetical protein